MPPSPPDPDALRPLARELGRRIAWFRPVSGGLTHATTGIATLDDGSRVFVKAGLEEHSRTQVSAELRNLRALARLAGPEATYLPLLLAAVDDPPMLALEDLSGGTWPEPYPENLEPLERALELLHSLPVPGDLASILDRVGPPGAEVLDRLGGDADHALGPAARWLHEHLPAIRHAIADIAPGSSLIHSDLWYSNLCFLGDRAVIVDWSHLAVGPPAFDRATVSIDLVLEGRPPLRVSDGAGWAASHLAWTTWAIARGAGPGIADPQAWLTDNLELFDGAAWWLADELGLAPPPRLSQRHPGW